MGNEAKSVIILIPAFILGTTSNLLQPEYSIKIVNTENIILSLGDLDEKNDDLELIKASPDPILKKKLVQFHKYVDTLEMERRAFKKSSKHLHYKPMNIISEFEISNEDLPFSIACDRKRWKMWERRPGGKRKRKNLRKKFLKHFKFKKYKLKYKKIHKHGISKRQMPIRLNDEQGKNEYDLAKDYWNFVNKSLNDNTAFEYSEEGKPEESVKDIVSKITDIKTPKNCSKVVSLGVQAVECIVQEFKNKEIDKKEMMRRISLIILIWIGIYMAFAIPLWCTKGWCCCCFRCDFCLPVTTVRKIQKYVAQNPPGIYINENGQEEYYNPTKKETELYESLTRSIAEF